MERVAGIFTDTTPLKDVIAFLEELGGRGRIKYYMGKGVIEIRVQEDPLEGVVEWI
jgi:hypothetical protein